MALGLTFSAGGRLPAATMQEINDQVDEIIDSVGQTIEKIQTASVYSPSATGAETTSSQVQLSGACISGYKYRVSYTGGYYGSSANAAGRVRLRYAAGSSITTSSTLVPGCVIACGAPTSGGIYPVYIAGVFTATSTGTWTFGATVDRYSGTGDFGLFSDNGSNAYGRLEIECVKVA